MSKQTCYASKLWVKLLPLPSLNTVLNINITNNFWEGIRNRHSHINHISIEGVNETMIGLEINRIGTLDFIVLHISSEDLDHPSLWWRWMTALTSAWTACPTSCSSTSSNTLMLSSSSRQSPRFSPSSRPPSVACIHILLKVCNLFHELASDETTWRVRVAKRFPGRDPVFTFTLICVVGSL